MKVPSLLLKILCRLPLISKVFIHPTYGLSLRLLLQSVLNLSRKNVVVATVFGVFHTTDYFSV